MADAKKSSFLEWITRYDKTIKTSPQTNAWLSCKGYMWNVNPFIYVKNKETLAMVGMYLGNDVRTTEKFILRNDINK